MSAILAVLVLIAADGTAVPVAGPMPLPLCLSIIAGLPPRAAACVLPGRSA